MKHLYGLKKTDKKIILLTMLEIYIFYTLRMMQKIKFLILKMN